MRRKDREIIDRNQIVQFLESCSTVRIGFRGDDAPYVLPVSFGISDDGDMLRIYFHSAKEGKKQDLIQLCNKVCVEADSFSGYVCMQDGITADYMSFIGFGTVRRCTDANEKIKGLDLLMKHCGFEGYPDKKCMLLDQTDVFVIALDEFSCKKRFQ